VKKALPVILASAFTAAAAVVLWQLASVRKDSGNGATAESTVASRASALSDVGSGPLRIQRPDVPRPVPELRFVDGEGKPRSLADFRGRAILLNVWATWCAPCREEMPALDHVQATLGGPDFDVVALSIDRGGVAAVKPFYEELDLRALRIYVDTSGESLAKLGAVGIPLTLLVDPQGRELWRVLGPTKWDQPEVLDRIRRDLAAKP
jgi:thiol-disulfide isomerase/thioredoxin